MARTDHEAVLDGLEDYLQAKHERGENTFGHRELTDVVARLKREHRVPEGLAEKAMRLYGPELTESLRRKPDAEDAARGLGNGDRLVRS